MSTTVTYKGDTLTTATNQTKVLETAGKYLEDDITITDVSSTATVVVTEEPDVNGGIIKNITATDISDTTAVASDVAQGKYFYTSSGVKTAGTASGGGGGLEYEEGTWTPSANTAEPTFLFQNTHTDLPCFVSLTVYPGQGSMPSDYSWMQIQFTNINKLADDTDVRNEQGVYAYVRRSQRGVYQAQSVFLDGRSEEYEIDTYLSTTGFAPTHEPTIYWRTGYTYKWIAVWAPTT